MHYILAALRKIHIFAKKWTYLIYIQLLLCYTLQKLLHAYFSPIYLLLTAASSCMFFIMMIYISHFNKIIQCPFLPLSHNNAWIKDPLLSWPLCVWREEVFLPSLQPVAISDIKCWNLHQDRLRDRGRPVPAGLPLPRTHQMSRVHRGKPSQSMFGTVRFDK